MAIHFSCSGRQNQISEQLSYLKKQEFTWQICQFLPHLGSLGLFGPFSVKWNGTIILSVPLFHDPNSKSIDIALTFLCSNDWLFSSDRWKVMHTLNCDSDNVKKAAPWVMMPYVMLSWCADKDALGVQGLLEAWAWWKWYSQDKCAQFEDAIQIWLPQWGAQFGDVWCCSAWSTQTCKKQRVVCSMSVVANLSVKWTTSFTTHIYHSSFGFSC